MSDTVTLKSRTRNWMEENPLRRWRKRNELSMMDAAATLGVGLSSVQNWEQGAYQPNEESMPKLADLLGVKPETLTRQWREWYRDRPRHTPREAAS